MIDPVQAFPLERWYARYEGRAPFDLSAASVLPPLLAELPGLESALRPGYAPQEGHPALRAAIAARHPGATPANVLVTTGSIEALYLLQRVLLGPGDRFVAPNPGYGALYLTGIEQGAEWVPWQVPWRGEDRWQSWHQALASRPKVVMLNTPHNPTGFTLDAAELRQAAADASAVGALLIADEVQRELQPEPPDPLFSLAPGTVSVGSLSKSVGLPGLRLGWIVGPPELITACATLKDRTTICINPISAAIGTAVLQDMAPWVARAQRFVADNGSRLEEWLADQPYLRGVVPTAGLTAFVRVAMQWPTLALADYLAEHWGLLLAPGDYFGAPGFVRFGLGRDPLHFADGLGRLRHALDAFVPPATD